MDPEQKPFSDEINNVKRQLANAKAAAKKEKARRQQAEKALRESEQRFKAISAISPAAIGISLADGKFIYTNESYERIFGYTMEELNHLKAGKLYEDPNDRLRWMDILQKNGSVQDYEVRLKRKDGTCFWALISVTPLQIQGIPAFLGIVADVSDLKLMEAALHASEQVYTEMFDKSPFALTLTLMPQGTLVKVNDKFLQLFGFTHEEVIGKTSVELSITPPESRAQVAAELQKNGSVQDFECIRKMKTGDQLNLSLSLNWVTVQGQKYILTTIRDVTAFKKTQQELAAVNLAAENEHKRLIALMEALPVGVAIIDAQGGNIQGNRAFEQVWGGPVPQVDGVDGYIAYKAWWLDTDELVQPEEWASAQAVQKGVTITGQQVKIQRFDGTFGYMLNSAAPIFDSQAQVAGCVVAIQDISELKLREYEINELNHTLRALSNSNQAMLHATNESGFLDEVCQIIIRDCGFAMVWIGYVQNDALKSVKPVASAGFEQGYLDGLKIALDDPERGQGPTGQAIRTKKPARCNNMLTDPCFTPWRQAALKQGYASSIVLPLIADDQAFGAINIYSKEPNGFSEEEEKLLAELAGDLAYGITALRLKAESSRFNEALARSEQRYRTLFDNMTEGFALHEIVCDKAGQPCDYRFLDINPSFERLTGLNRETTIGRLASEVLPALEPFWVETYGKVTLTGEPVQVEDYTAVLGRYFQVYAFRLVQGQFATIFFDVTDRKRYEERLTYLATFPENNPRPVLEADLDGNITYANPAAQRLLPDLVKAGRTHHWLPDWEAIVAWFHNKPADILDRDASIDDLYFQLSLNYLPAQGLVRIYGVEITDRKRIEQALQQVSVELEQRVQDRTQELDIANNQLRAEVLERQKAQADLETNVQELQVIEEELRNNNDMLVDAQKVLDDERQRYRDLFELAPDAYLVTDVMGNIREANEYSSYLLGVPHDNLIGKPLVIFTQREDHIIFSHLLATVSHDRTMQAHEFRIIPRHGKEITASCRVTFGKEPDNSDTLRWTIRDISQRKRNEEIIRQNSLRNAALSEISQSLADASLDEKAILDIVVKTTSRLMGDACIITMATADRKWLEPAAMSHKKPEVLELMSSMYGTSHNPSNVGLFGQVFQSTKPLILKELSPADAQAHIPPQYQHYLEHVGISSLMVVPIKLADKTIGTLSLLRDRDSLPYTDDDLSMLEIIAGRTGQTIHNARLYQELQAAMRKELETHDQLVQAEKFAAVGRLLASITHEINNPLQTIKNCLYLSQLDTTPGTPIHDSLTIATNETNRLSNLVAQLRELYRPPTRGLTKPVSLLALVDEVQVLLASFLLDKHVRWEVTPPESEFSHMTVEGVPDQLKQVFLNISLNAIDAMETTGGGLSINFKVSPEANQVGVCFRDTGPGLPAEVKDNLFEPFMTTKEKGLGLGLVICYDIIQKHNGRIEVESEAGKGAAFTVWLPARRE